MKRPSDSSDAPEASNGTLPQTKNKLKRKRQGCILLARGRMGTSRLRQQESRRKEFVVDSGAGMHMVSKKDVNSAEL